MACLSLYIVCIMKSSLPNIEQDFAQWYQEVVYRSALADQSPVRGALVIRPYGYALWELIKNILDMRIKHHGTQNAAFPLFIPLSFLQKEAEHVEGFAPELAIVTHAGGKELEEPYVVRPTSETIIHYMFARWIRSWRDLPLKINQWSNVIRWEMRPRAFLRTTEIFWQEGHTAHETLQEAKDFAETMWHEYIDFYEKQLAIPTIAGMKTEQEKFAGATATYTVEGLMQDGKALQLCTSHLISQAFAKSFNMMFQDRTGEHAYPYLTSWGFTTRSIGAIIMVHGDQKGLVLPPLVAPIQVLIIPIIKKGYEEEVKKSVNALADQLGQLSIRVEVDNREALSPGAKFYEWELKGIPLRIELGPKDIAQGVCVVTERYTNKKETIFLDNVVSIVKQQLNDIQVGMLEVARDRLNKNVKYIYNKLDLINGLQKGGFLQAGWCEQQGCEQALKKYQASIRCVLSNKRKMNTCFWCEQPAQVDVLVAKAY